MINKEIFIKTSDSIINALKKLDKTEKKVLLVVDGNERLLGTISGGRIEIIYLSSILYRSTHKFIVKRNNNTPQNERRGYKWGERIMRYTKKILLIIYNY